MAVVNRCAVGIYPSQKLIDWAQGLDLDIDAAGASEPCLYLIPDYETEEEAEEILEEVFEAIFEAELDFWHRDTGAWPAERQPQSLLRGGELRQDPAQLQGLAGQLIHPGRQPPGGRSDPGPSPCTRPR